MVLVKRITQVALSLVFVYSSLTKIRDRRSFSESLSNLGVPVTLRPIVNFLLPIVEISLSVALFLPAIQRKSAKALSVLIALFTWLLARNIRRGNLVACACFGSTSRVISKRDLVRNAFLMVGTTVLYVDLDAIQSAGARVNQHVLRSRPSLVAATLMVALSITITMLLTVIHRYGKLLYRMENEKSHSSPSRRQGLSGPLFASAMNGSKIEVMTKSLVPRAHTFQSVLFVGPNCKHCQDLIEALRTNKLDANRLLIATNDPEYARDLVDAGGISKAQVVVDSRGDLGLALEVTGVPSLFVLASTDGIEVERFQGRDEVRERLVHQTSSSPVKL